MSLQKDITNIIERVGVPIGDFEGKSILITGGSGFLGSWFVAIFEELNKTFRNPCKVMVVDSYIATDRQNRLKKIPPKNITFVGQDVSKIEEWEQYDYIIHAAGIASPIHYRKYPIATIDGMVLGLVNLMRSVVEKPVDSMLVFSSSEIYGNPTPDMVPTPETYNGNVSCNGPRSCYDESKRMEEAICAAYYRIHNIPVKWVRPFNVSGPGMGIKDDRVVPKFIYQALQGKQLTVHKPSTQTRTFCYITDAMVGFLKTLLIGRNGEVYNIGRDKEEVTIDDLAKAVVKNVNPKIKIKYVEMPTEYPKDQAQRRCPNISKAREHLEYHPEVDLDEIIKRSKEFFKTQL